MHYYYVVVLPYVKHLKQAVRVATQYAPAPLLPRRAPPSRRYVAVHSRAEYVHADRCSRLTR